MAVISGSDLYLNQVRSATSISSISGSSRFRLLTVEGIDLATHQHIGQDKIFQDLDSLRRAGFVIIAERFKEILARSVPLTFTHPHLTATFLDDSHNTWMRDSGTNIVCCIVDFLGHVRDQTRK